MTSRPDIVIRIGGNKKLHTLIESIETNRTDCVRKVEAFESNQSCLPSTPLPFQHPQLEEAY